MRESRGTESSEMYTAMYRYTYFMYTLYRGTGCTSGCTYSCLVLKSRGRCESKKKCTPYPCLGGKKVYTQLKYMAIFFCCAPIVKYPQNNMTVSRRSKKGRVGTGGHAPVKLRSSDDRENCAYSTEGVEDLPIHPTFVPNGPVQPLLSNFWCWVSS